MPHLSDHCHVTYAIKAILAGSPVSSSCSNGCTLSEHNRLLWDTKLKSKIKECLESQIVQSKLQAALRNDNVDTAAELFSETLRSKRFVWFRPEQTTRNESQRPGENPFLGPSFAPKQCLVIKSLYNI